jgi:hypothetical protein
VSNWLEEYGLNDTVWQGSNHIGMERHMVPASDQDNIATATSLAEIVGDIRENRDVDAIDAAVDNICYNAIYPKYVDDVANWTFFKDMTVGQLMSMVNPFATVTKAMSIRDRIWQVDDKAIEPIDLSVPGARSLILQLEETPRDEIVLDINQMSEWERKSSPLCTYSAGCMTERSMHGIRVDNVMAYKTEGEEIGVVFLDDKNRIVRFHYLDLPTYSIGSLSFVDDYG